MTVVPIGVVPVGEPEVITTNSGLQLPADMTYESWAEVGARLVRMGEGIMWWLGDWWRFGERAYGEAAAQAVPTGYATETLRKAAWVAERIESGRRRTDLPFGHHQAVAALEPAEQDAVLAKAAAEHLSVKAVREEVRARRPATARTSPADSPEEPFTPPEWYESLAAGMRALHAALRANDVDGERAALGRIARDCGLRLDELGLDGESAGTADADSAPAAITIKGEWGSRPGSKGGSTRRVRRRIVVACEACGGPFAGSWGIEAAVARAEAHAQRFHGGHAEITEDLSEPEDDA